MVTPTLQAGAGRASIELGEELFPIEGFIGTHDPLHVRVLLLECRVRVALVSIEMTSLPEEQIELLQREVARTAVVPAENVWICVSHSMSAPHIKPQHMQGTAAERHKSATLAAAVVSAVRSAADQAAADLQETSMGHGSGVCDVNISRDVLTSEGWWLGRSETGSSDKTLSVVRFEGLDGHPIALLFSHCVRPAVMENPPGAEAHTLVTADLAGAACSLVEKEYGDGTTALFFMGAAGDQTSCLAGARSEYLGRDGLLHGGAVEESGYIVAEMIGVRMGAEVIRVSEEIDCRPSAGELTAMAAEERFPGQEIMDTRSIRPTKHHVFPPGPERVERLEVLALGDLALLGVRPELSCRTGVDVRQRSPFAETLVLTMVNGGAKCMADRDAYERFTYEAMNSRFAAGSAEILADRAVAMLEDMWSKRASNR